MPTASSSTAAVPSLHPHQRSAQSSHHAAADRKAGSPFSMLVDAATVPDQPPRPDTPTRDSAPRDTDIPPSRDQAAPANASDRQAAPTDRPADQPADQPTDKPAETAIDAAGQPNVLAADAGTPETAPTEDAEALLAEASDQATAVDQKANESDTRAIAAASVSPTPAPPTPPAAAIAIPIVTADVPAPTESAGSDQIAAVTDGALPAAAATAGPQQPVKPGLSPLPGKPGDSKASDKAGESAGNAKGPVQAGADQPGPSNSGKAASAPATPKTDAAPAAADGGKKADVPHYAGEAEAARHGAEPADTTQTPDRPAATAGDNRLSNLHLVSTASGHDTLQAVGAAAAGMSAAATGQTTNGGVVSAAVPISSIPVEIAARAQAGSNRFEIRLDPPELGRIDVRLDVDRHGNVTSRLIAERSDTLDLLRREAPQLERALQDAGLKTGDNGLQFSLRDQGPGAERNTRENPDTTKPKAETPEPEPLPVEALRSYRWSGGTGGVDIRV